jgi:hypothetical protein
MREVMNMKENEKTFETIKELYDWAVENGYENYKAFVCDEGWYCDIYLREISVDKEKKEISL